MRIAIFSSLFLLGFSNLDAAPCNQVVTISSPQWFYPSTLQKPHSTCTFSFTVPPGSYATLAGITTNLSTTDVIKMNDNLFDSYNYNHIYQTCGTNCPPLNVTINWPTNFEVTVYTGSATTMRLQMTVSLKAFNYAVNIVDHITTANNTQSSVVYFQDMKPGTSYQITSKNSQINLQTPLVFKPDEDGTRLNNVFVIDGGKVVGTLAHVDVLGFISNSSKVFLYVADSIPIRGAVLINDQSNIQQLYKYSAFYAPVYNKDKTGYATDHGGADPPQEGAVTFIGDKDGSTPITISDVDNMDFGGTFWYLSGGPLSSHADFVTPLTFQMLPKALSGNVNTVYISQFPGDIEYKTTGN